MAAVRPFYSQVPRPRRLPYTYRRTIGVFRLRMLGDWFPTEQTRRWGIQANRLWWHSAIFKNNFTMLGFVFATGFAFELGFNGAMNKYWDHLNRGRQWKDIRHKYAEAADDDEE